MKYFTVLILIVVIWFGTNYWNSRTLDSQIKPINEVITAEKGDMQITIESTGSIIPEREIEIKCEASGEIAKLPIEVSHIVKKGDLLLQLDPRDEERLVKRAKVTSLISKDRLKQEKINLAISQMELKNEKSRLDTELISAKTVLQGTEAKLKRIKHLQKKKMASQEEVEEVKTEHAKTLAALEQIKIAILNLEKQKLEIERLKHNISIAEQNVLNNKIDLADAEERLRETRVLSPIDGVVSTCDVQVGQIISSGTTGVNGGTTVLYLADMSKLYVLVSVDESDIGRICNGQDVKVTVDAFPDKTFKGKVVRVAIKGNSNSNVVTYEVKVEIELSNNYQLKLGMTANVEILIIDKKDILKLPAKAVHQTTKGCYVMLSDKNSKSIKQNIKIGETDGDFIEITEGLNTGDKVLAALKEKSLWTKSNDNEKNSMNGMPPSMLGGGGGPR